MKYKYRNFPCTVGRGNSLWCVSGTDNKGGSGILEWCISKEDAEYMKSMMEEETGRFDRLTVEEHVRYEE